MIFSTISREAIRIGDFVIYWYAILIVGGAILATYLASREADRKNLPPEFISDLLFYAFPIGIIGARIYYVAFKWEDYQHNLLKVFALWEGGIAIYGGLIAGLVAVIWYSKRRNVPYLLTLDIIAPVVLLAQSIGRWGNFINQEAYGAVVTRAHLENLFIPPFIIDHMYIDGAYRQPTFLYESVLSFIGFILLIILRHKVKSLTLGDITLLYVIWYGIERFIVEGMRSDSLYLGAIRVSQWLSIVLVVLSVIIYMFKRLKVTQTYSAYWHKR